MDLKAKLAGIVGRWTDESYAGSVTKGMPDTALLGNGDVGVTSSGSAGVKTFLMSKGDFWTASPEPMPLPVGGVTIEYGEGFREEVQHLLDPRITTTTDHLVMDTWLAAEQNVLVTSITADRETELTISVYAGTAGASAETLWAERTAAPGAWVSRAQLTTRILGASKLGDPHVAGDRAQRTATISPGTTLQVVTTIGDHPADPQIDQLRAATTTWWEHFWQQSAVDLGDDILERFYYAAQYFLGASSRPGKAAPGLHGLWTTTDEPYFHGDFHLNYNAQAPYYGTYSSNRPELVLPFFAIIDDYLDEARRRAREDLGRVQPSYVERRFPAGGVPDGVLFPVGLGLHGSTTDDIYLNQVSNALFTTSQYVQYFEYTQDRQILDAPILRATADFFTHYLEWNGEQYELWSGPHEGTWGRNSSPDIALLKQLLGLLTKELTDPDPRWQHILDHLPAVPTTSYDGKTVYSLVDPGTMTGDDRREIRPGDNTVNLEFVHPADQPVPDRQILIDTLDAMDSWDQDNSFPKVFTHAVRGGYPPSRVIEILREVIVRRQAANLRIADTWHGLEKSGATEAINSMLVQTVDGVITVFPAWPMDRDAAFDQLRQKGAFLVSSRLRAGQVTQIDVVSTVGGPLAVRNPWAGAFTVNGTAGRGELITESTNPGDRLTLRPGV